MVALLPVPVSFIKINTLYKYILCYLEPFSRFVCLMRIGIVSKGEVWSSGDSEAESFYLLVISDTVGLITADAAITSAAHLSRN